MSKIKMDKKEIYMLIAEHAEWFPKRKRIINGGERETTRYRTCLELEGLINELLKKAYDENKPNSKYDPPFIKLHGATLTALVNDRVLVRKRDSSDTCFTYCPVYPINEDYCL